ncbi:CBS domain-containing protein [candidate division KSB1 bacterium]|nr:CBS domain-containing protein [candidate division KSB1 bacterium]
MNLIVKSRQLFNRYAISTTGRLFLASIIVGIIAGLGAILFFTLLSWLSHLTFHHLAHYFPPEPHGETSGVETIAGLSIRWWIVLLAPAIGGLISGLLVFSFAPEAEGHGTDAVIEAFHHKRGRIRKRVPFIKTIASIITIGSGGSAGREGPIAQIGAGFGSHLAKTLRLSDDERRILLIAGAAGGIGSIFRSPLGGALFAVEVLYRRDFEAKGLIPALVSSILAYSIFTARFGWGFLFKTPTFVFNHPVELLFYAGLGLLCAAVGFFYIKTFYGLRDQFFHRIRIKPHFKPAIGGLMIGAIGVFAPHILASGYGYLQQAMNGELTIQFMLIAAFLKIFATSFTISSGGSGGVFAPSLYIGGMLGGAFGQLAEQLFPTMIDNPTSFVLVGMGAFFAGAAKVPISSMIMVSEMTGGYQLLVPMMLASSTSYVTTSKINLYEQQVRRMADSPAHLGDFTIDVLDTIMVEQAYHPMSHVPVLFEDTPLAKFQNMVTEHQENYFPVVDKQHNIVGIISLKDVRSVLFEDTMGSFLIAKDLMNKPVTVTPAESLKSAMKKFTTFQYEQIPVVHIRDNRILLGMLSYEDVIAAYDHQVNRRKLDI